MSSKSDRVERDRKVISKRLKELLDRCNCSQARLLRKVERMDGGLKMTSAQLSQIVNGKRTLMPDFAKLFSKALDIEPGYLLGADNYYALNYDDYLERYGLAHEREMQRDSQRFEKYDSVFELIDAALLGMTSISRPEGDEEIIEYITYEIEYKHRIVSVPGEIMDKFFEDAKRYASLLFGPIAKKYVNDTYFDESQ